MIIEKNISQVAVGSYIVGIVKQTGNMVIKNPGWVRDFNAIERLIHQGVKRVEVDTSKKLAEKEQALTSDLQAEEASSLNDANKPIKLEGNSEPQVEVSQTKGHRKAETFGERLIVAKKVFEEAKTIQANIIDGIANNRPVDIEDVSKFVDNSISMVFENPDALTCVLNIRSKDEYLLEHSVSVSVLMTVFSVYMGLNKGLVKQLAIGGFLHDVGKVKIPDHILNKPDKLTDDEFEIIKKHAQYSKDIVSNLVGISENSRAVVANHHEKLNGTGYPQGLKGESLSMYDRMISICDIFDALSADRVYKPGIPLLKAFAILRELAADNQLDKILVDKFIRCMGVFPVGSLVKLKSNRIAVVDERNEETPTKPQVTAFFNLSQNTFTELRKIDLYKTPNDAIEKSVRAKDFGLDMKKISEMIMMQA